MRKTICLIVSLLSTLSLIINASAEVNKTPNISNITQKQKVVILMYHHILSNNENKLFKDNGTVLSLESFNQQMKYLNDNGYNTITMKELEDFIYFKRPLSKSKNNLSVLITFDDGYLSNYLRAYPVLKKYGFRATVFSATSDIPHTTVNIMNPDKLERISLEQMIISRDVFDYESHSHTFHKKDSNNISYLISKNKDEIIEDIQTSMNILGSSKYFAYPYGEYDDEAIDALITLGFKLAFTNKPGYITHNNSPYALPRHGVFPWTSFNQFKKIFN